MGHAAVAGDGLHQRTEQAWIALPEQRFDATVLVTELDLEVVHGLAEAHEAEGSRLDHAGVDGPHLHLVHLLSGELVKRELAHGAGLGPLEAHRLEPGMPSYTNAG